MKKIYIIILFLICLIEFFIFQKLFSYSFIFVDDVNQILNSSLNDILLHPDNGQYISSFLGGIFRLFIPKELSIHPSYFKSHYFSYIQSLIFLGFIFILTNLIFINKKINYLYISGFIFVSSLLFFILQQQPIFSIYVYEGLFRMILPIFIFACLLYLFVKNLEKFTIKKSLIIFILTFLCSISNEPVCVMTNIGFILYFLLSIRNTPPSQTWKKYSFAIYMYFNIDFRTLFINKNRCIH